MHQSAYKTSINPPGEVTNFIGYMKGHTLIQVDSVPQTSLTLAF